MITGVLRSADVAWTSVQEVILTGGVAQMPQIQDAITQLCGQPVNISENAVARGAAQAAARYRPASQAIPSVLALERIYRSIKINAGSTSRMAIRCNAPIPTCEVIVINLPTPISGGVAIIEEDPCGDCSLLAKISCSSTPRSITVITKVSWDGIVEISASGNGVSIRKSEQYEQMRPTDAHAWDDLTSYIGHLEGIVKSLSYREQYLLARGTCKILEWMERNPKATAGDLGMKLGEFRE